MENNDTKQDHDTKQDKAPKKLLVDDVNDNRAYYFLAFFLVGVINNNGWTLCQAGASNLANQFEQ